MSRERIWKRKNTGTGRTERVLTLVFVLAAVCAAAVFLCSSLAPKLLYCAAARLYLSELDTSDNGVSDYYPIYAQTEEYSRYALSIVPDVPECYTFAADYLKYLNRERGVNRIVLNIPSRAADMLNGGLGGTLDEEYFDITSGGYCASVEFEDFLSDITVLNSTLLPENRITFVGIGDDPAAEYAASGDGTLLICSRSEAHTDGCLCSLLTDAGCEFLLTDILCCRAETSSGGSCSDIIPPFLSEGTYIFRRGRLEWAEKYLDFTLRLHKKEASGFSAISGPGGGFSIIIAGAEDESVSGLFQ